MSDIFENKGALATTILVAASDSLNQGQANYVCDGVADDVEINAALATGAGGKVILLDGNYQITANLVVPADTHLSGMGKGTILTTTDADGITNMVVINGNNVTISDMKLVLGAGAGDAGSRPNVIYASSKTLIWLENLWTVGDESVADDASDLRQCGILFDTVTGSKIIDCRVDDNRRYGIRLADSSNNNTVTGNTCQGSIGTGILTTGSSNNTVTGNTCQGNIFTGIHIDDSSNNNTVTGNTCQGNTGGIGIYINDSSNNTVTGNTCQDNGDGGIRLTGSSNNTVTGNTCQGNTNDGILTTGSSNNTVTGNTCQGNTGHNIYIHRSSYCVITGNSCNGSTGADGINVTGDGTANSDFNEISGNVCYGNAGNGIEIVGGTDANGNLIKANITMNNTGRGVVDAGTYTIFDQVMHSIALDLTGGATDIEVFFAKCPCILAGYSILYSIATGAGAGVNVRVGRYQDGVALDDDHFDVSVSELNEAKGYSKHFVTADLTNTVIAAGDTITVGTAGGKADTGSVILILEIAEMSN